MKRYHKYTYEEIDDMIPFERDIELILLTETIEKEKPENKQESLWDPQGYSK